MPAPKAQLHGIVSLSFFMYKSGYIKIFYILYKACRCYHMLTEKAGTATPDPANIFK